MTPEGVVTMASPVVGLTESSFGVSNSLIRFRRRIRRRVDRGRVRSRLEEDTLASCGGSIA